MSTSGRKHLERKKCVMESFGGRARPRSPATSYREMPNGGGGGSGCTLLQPMSSGGARYQKDRWGILLMNKQQLQGCLKMRHSQRRIGGWAPWLEVWLLCRPASCPSPSRAVISFQTSGQCCTAGPGSQSTRSLKHEYRDRTHGNPWAGTCKWLARVAT